MRKQPHLKRYYYTILRASTQRTKIIKLSKIEDTSSFTIDGTTIKGYNGGELYATATFTPVGEIKNAALQLGSLRGIAADLYCIRIYNRALSAAEISANYAIDKMRFDL